MDAFERSAGEQCRLARDAEHGRALDQEERPQSFSAAEAGVAHGVHQPLRARDLVGFKPVRQKLSKQSFGFLRGLVQTLRKVEGSAGHSVRLQGRKSVRTILYAGGFVNCGTKPAAS